MDYQIHSANNWLSKVGAYIDENNKLVLPDKSVILPLTHASEGMDEFRVAKNYHDQMKAIQSIAFNVRAADTSFFDELARRLNSQLPQKYLCGHCIRKNASPLLVKLRRRVNARVLHIADKGLPIHPDAFPQTTRYYKEFLELPLVDVTKLGNRSIQQCPKCEERFAKEIKR